MFNLRERLDDDGILGILKPQPNHEKYLTGDRGTSTPLEPHHLDPTDPIISLTTKPTPFPFF